MGKHLAHLTKNHISHSNPSFAYREYFERMNVEASRLCKEIAAWSRGRSDSDLAHFAEDVEKVLQFVHRDYILTPHH